MRIQRDLMLEVIVNEKRRIERCGGVLIRFVVGSLGSCLVVMDGWMMYSMIWMTELMIDISTQLGV